MEMVMGRTKSLMSALLFISANGSNQRKHSMNQQQNQGADRVAKAAEIRKRPAVLGPTWVQAASHMLRHACGYAPADKGHDTRALQAYLGHRNIRRTVRDTELSLLPLLL